jgi:predicted nucleic acid-binding protein
MKTFVIDTSVLLAWYLPEAQSRAAREWRKKLLEGSVKLIVPSFHYWEFGNVLRTYILRKEIPEDLAREIFDLHLEAPLEIRDPDKTAVFDTALTYGASMYDAVFITLSLSLDFPFITAEKSTTPWVIKMADKVIPVK